MPKPSLCLTMFAGHDFASTETSKGNAALLERVFQPEGTSVKVGSPDERHASSSRPYERAIFPLLIGIVVYAALRNLAEAATKPLWFDELITQLMSRQPSISALWSALKTAADGNPPPFYLIERAAAAFPANEFIAYRLPSIMAFSLTLICLYFFVERRSGPMRGLLCVSVLFLTPLYTLYADEARPYSMLVACIAFALVCYQRQPGALWTVGLFLSLTLALCLHYYAVFAFVPFFAAELVSTYESRRPRPFIWLALLLSLSPLVFFRPFLLALRTYYGASLWSRPQLNDVMRSYGEFFRVDTPWGVALAALCVAAVLGALLTNQQKVCRGGSGRQSGNLG